MGRPARVVLLLLFLLTVAQCQDFDIGSTLTTSFRDIALLPTRLTYYNQHEDAALASYTCCKKKQEKEIQAALVANAAFLHRFSDTPYADDTYLHYAYVSSFKPEAFRNEEWGYRSLVEIFPDSDLADDAAWRLGNLYQKDYDHEQAIEVFEYLVDKWPDSTWADDALCLLLTEYTRTANEQAALDTLNQLAYDYPKSEFCPRALHMLANKYMEVQDYESAINVSADLIRDFRFSDYADDAQMRIAEALRRMGDLQGALQAYDLLIEEWHGSTLTTRAMGEANTLIRRLQQMRKMPFGEPYEPRAWNPAKEAEELWNAEAKHYQNNGMHDKAVEKFMEFIERFPGHDRWDDAWFEIGQTYWRQHMLFDEINQAAGPEDIARVREDYVASTGDTGPVPTDGNLSALEDAMDAYARIANDFHGSSLQCMALGMVARCYTPYGEIDSDKVRPDAAYTYQEIVIHFPFNSARFDFFTDASVPVFSFCKLIKFYANPKNWEYAQQMYPDLSAEYPGIFPQDLEQNRDAFYELMNLYNLKVSFAYYEMSKHIKYALGPRDLLPEAHLFQSAMLMAQGDFARAAELLEPVANMQGHDLVPPALYLYAQANVKLGNWDAAQWAFSKIVDEHANSGLADDARMCWQQYEEAAADPTKHNFSEAAQKVYARYGINPEYMDTYVSDGCVVFCPYTRAPLMRMYNMPNIWDEAQSVMRDWAELKSKGRVTIVVDTGSARDSGNPFKVPGSAIKDPPQWNLGLVQIAANVLAEGVPHLSKSRDLLGGIAEFAAASLQYDLVTETRDAIGSAAAVKLPQEDVIRAREGCLKALADYVIQGEDAKLNGRVVAGMMYSLLDSNGFTKTRLIDREPYRSFFAKLRDIGADTKSGKAFAVGATAAFGENCAQQLKDWRLPLPQTASVEGDVKVGMLR